MLSSKRNKFGGISTVIVMALVIAVSIAIAVYFISYFLGLSSSVVGASQAMVLVETFSTSATQLTIKNTGSVPIVEALIKFESLSQNNTTYCMLLKPNSTGNNIPAGASLSLICSYQNNKATCIITPENIGMKLASPSTTTKDPLASFEASCTGYITDNGTTVLTPGSYRVIAYLYYANGKIQIKDLGTFSTS